MYGEELSRQLALDYCCSPADVADSKNHFSIYAPQEGRRRFQEALIRGLKIAVVNGKLLFTGSEEIVAECRKRYANVTGEWFFDAKRLREIEELLLPFHLRVAQAHPFFLPEADVMPSSGIPLPDASDALAFDLIRYDQNAILQFREANRFDEAFAFDPYAPDVLGIAAAKDASRMRPYFQLIHKRLHKRKPHPRPLQLRAGRKNRLHRLLHIFNPDAGIFYRHLKHLLLQIQHTLHLNFPFFLPVSVNHRIRNRLLNRRLDIRHFLHRRIHLRQK